MAFKDLREWIKFLDTEGQLRKVKVEVTVEDGEVGRVAAEACRRSIPWVNTPGVLFENIKGYKDSSGSNRIFCNSLNTWQRINWALGLPEDTKPVRIIDHMRKAIIEAKEGGGGKPIVVKTGPCKENIRKGADADLTKILPVLVISEKDGGGLGRYLTTYGGWVCKDPETGKLNVGLYRGQMLDNHSIGVLMVADAHWRATMEKYVAQGVTKIPVVYFTGWIPELILLTGTPVTPFGVCEYDVLGILRSQPVELVSSEMFPDLLVPANAEVVIEGYVHADPAEFRPEGPFGEYTGHIAGASTPKPWVEVVCITNRKDAIWQFMVRGGAPPYEEEALIHCIGASSHYWNMLDAVGVKGITGVFSPLASVATTMRVSVHQIMQYQATQIGCILSAARPAWFSRNVFVFDDDIDITNEAECNWAFAFRFDTEEDLHTIKVPGSVLDPRTPVEKRIPAKHGQGVWTAAIFDCTKPFYWDPRPEWGGAKYPPIIDTSPELMKKIDGKWDQYFPKGLIKK